MKCYDMEHKDNTIFQGTDNPIGFKVSTNFYQNSVLIHNLFFNNNRVYY